MPGGSTISCGEGQAGRGMSEMVPESVCPGMHVATGQKVVWRPVDGAAGWVGRGGLARVRAAW
jgi:hypothetical protein